MNSNVSPLVTAFTCDPVFEMDLSLVSIQGLGETHSMGADSFQTRVD